MFFSALIFLLFSQVSSHWALSVVLKTQVCTAAETFCAEWSEKMASCALELIFLFMHPHTLDFFTHTRQSLTLISRSAC